MKWSHRGGVQTLDAKYNLAYIIITLAKGSCIYTNYISDPITIKINFFSCLSQKNQATKIEKHYNSKQNERGFYALSILVHSLQTINTLRQNNISSDNLNIFNIVIEGVIDDTCRWVSPY